MSEQYGWAAAEEAEIDDYKARLEAMTHEEFMAECGVTAADYEANAETRGGGQ